MTGPAQAQTGVELEDRPCPLGCRRGDDPVLRAGDRLYGLPGEFDLVRCRGCGLLRTNPRPTPSAMGARYPEEYAPHRAPARAVPQRRIGRLARRLFALDTRRLPPLAPGSLLEIGCAAGAYLDEMAGRGWRVRGIEFSAAAASQARARGHQVHVGPLETAPGPEAPYDLVVGWMVLEHLHEPIACLRKLQRWSRPRAWLAISVPNCASLERRLFGRDWYALHLPNHLFHYTPETLRRVLALGGWRVERILHQRTLANLVGSLGLALERRRPGSRLAKVLVRFPRQPGTWAYALYPLAWLLARLGQTGRMTVWAIREDA